MFAGRPARPFKRLICCCSGLLVLQVLSAAVGGRLALAWPPGNLGHPLASTHGAQWPRAGASRAARSPLWQQEQGGGGRRLPVASCFPAAPAGVPALRLLHSLATPPVQHAQLTHVHFLPSLQDLPSELIGRVLALAGRRHAASAAATCRQLNATFWSQPALWQDIQLAVSPRVACMGGPQLVAWCAAQRRWLQRVAPMVRQARFVSCEPEASGGEPSTMEMTVVGCHIADLLHALEGAPLERLFVEVW